MKTLLVLLLVVFVATACVRLTDENGNDVKVQWGKESSFSAERTVQVPTSVKQLLRAQVKGSVYETGEMVSVFGTCLNATDEPISTGTYATMSAWYPNGTMFFSNVSMDEIQPGYYLYSDFMSAVQGTYLTEFLCHVNGSAEFAKAWGEWQNPMWVKRLADLNNTLSNLNFSVNLTPIQDQLNNISLQIGNMSVNMTNSFEITWQNQNTTNVYINETFQNLTQQLTVISSVANSSVDRNDSYLAWLIQQIIVSTGAPINRSLYVTVDADPPILHSNWEVRIAVLNEYNVTVGYPVISCFINTTNLPDSTKNQLMTAASGMKFSNGETHTGFKWSEKINLLDSFDYVTWCVYN